MRPIRVAKTAPITQGRRQAKFELGRLKRTSADLEPVGRKENKWELLVHREEFRELNEPIGVFVEAGAKSFVAS